jgi:hypothetical protein
MSRRGEIVIECSTPKCHGELVLTADDVAAYSVMRRLRMAGWEPETDRCPDCVEESDSREETRP